MTKWCGWFKSPDNVPLKAVGPACFLVSSSFLALPLLLWNSWPFPSISELSLSWFSQVSFLAYWWWWGWYRVDEEARKPAQMLGPELDWVISRVSEVVRTKEPQKVKGQNSAGFRRMASRGLQFFSDYHQPLWPKRVGVEGMTLPDRAVWWFGEAGELCVLM